MTARLKVLVAGNEDGTAKELTDAFTPLGWEVIQARDAVSATAALLRSRPDAVVLFGNLPGGGAVLVLRRLRASVHTAMTPVFGVSGRRAEDADELRAHGIDECVAPPANPAAIRAWIQSRLLSPQVVMEAPAGIIREPNRLDALNHTGLLDSPPEESFDSLTGLTSSLLGVPVALVSLVDSHRQFFKSQVGLGDPWATQRETPLTHSFCQWVVAGHEELVIGDARTHPVLSNNRALADLGVIAYAGVPITATNGESIGSLCAIDNEPHEWSGADIDLLRGLGQVAEASIAVSEAIAAERRTSPDPETDVIARSLVLRALGIGIERCTHLMQRADPALTGAQQLTLVKLVGWFGRHIARMAGA